jgi:outer membrane murein-binding lipoprotein Lpp
MPPRTNSDKIDELSLSVAALTARLDALSDRFIELAGDTSRLRTSTEQHTTRLTVVEREVENLKKSGDEWGRRLWGLVQVLIGAAVGGAITYLLKR